MRSFVLFALFALFAPFAVAACSSASRPAVSAASRAAPPTELASDTQPSPVSCQIAPADLAEERSCGNLATCCASLPTATAVLDCDTLLFNNDAAACSHALAGYAREGQHADRSIAFRTRSARSR